MSKSGLRDGAGLLDEDLDVLPGGVEHLGHALIRHQPVEGREVEIARQRVDDGGLVRSGHLDQAELRPEGAFAQEFGIDGDEGGAGKPLAEGGERAVFGYDRVFKEIGLHRRPYSEWENSCRRQMCRQPGGGRRP